MTLELKVGAVFRWDNFSDQRYGPKQKPRWFIYLGESDRFSQVLIAYICTTTTQKQKFQAGGPRSSRDYYEFKAENSPFDEDCIIDFDEPPYSKEKEKLENNPNIMPKGYLSEDIMRMIYNRLLKSRRRLSRAALLDIHSSFNKAGIVGLKKPK